MIDQETIDRIRHSTNLVELVGETVKLTRRGRSFVGLCPFHKEKTPSFHVNEERGFYHCFGCQAHGDAIRFAQEMEGLEFVEAIRRLAERAGIAVVETHSDAQKKQQSDAQRQKQLLYDVNQAAAVFFERMLREHPLAHYARAELESRSLPFESNDSQIAATLAAFRVGYAPAGWDALAQYLRTAGLSHRAAEAAGLLSPRKSGVGHYDRFRHRLMFAVLDPAGKVIAFSGRALPSPDDTSDGRPQNEATGPAVTTAKYMNSPESAIYKKREVLFGLYQARSHIRAELGAVVVEGNFDVVSLHAQGVGHVVAPLGTAFTAEQAQKLKRYTPQVTFLFDGDSAGKRAVFAARQACRTAELDARVAELPAGTDPDLFVRSHGRDALKQVLRAARGQLEYMIDSLLDGGFVAHDARSKTNKIKQVLELLAEEKDPTLRSMAEQHANRIAERLGIQDVQTFRALARNVQQTLSGQTRQAAQERPEPPHSARSSVRRDDISREILGTFLDYPELLGTPEASESIGFVEGDYAAAIAALRQDWNGQDLQNLEQVLAKMAAPIHSFARARLAAPRHEQLSAAKTELLANFSKLKNLTLSQQKLETLEQIERAAKLGDFETELDLLRAQQRRARQRHGLH